MDGDDLRLVVDGDGVEVQLAVLQDERFLVELEAGAGAREAMVTKRSPTCRR